MHKVILKCFDLLRQFVDFIKLVIVLNMMFYILYWIEHIINYNWKWLNFIRPFYDYITNIASSICDASFYIFSAYVEVKYFIIILFVSILVFLLKCTINYIYELERLYGNVRITVKKVNANIMNKSLHDAQEKQELKLNKYIVMIYTRVKQRASYTGVTVDIEEQNKLMNDFIKEKTNTEFVAFQRGFMYQFTNYKDIDSVLDILFKVLNSKAPLDYAICIQVENDLKKLNKLIDLKQFGKITIAADTAYRYKFNSLNKYKTAPVGVYQTEQGTMEIHEFKENL